MTRDIQKIKQAVKKRRSVRVRAKIHGTSEIPRLSVHRSLKDIYAQLIDDDKGITMVSVSGREIDKKLKGKKVDISFKIGELLSKKAQEKGISKVVFDKSSYKYHGRVKAVAEGARKGGLKF